MSPPENRLEAPAAGQPVTVLVAGADGPVSARVRPLTGDDELRIEAAAGSAAGRPPALFEAVLLDHSVDRLDGVPSTAAALDALPLGDRNRLLLATLVASYGAPVELILNCTAKGCGEAYEFPLDAPAILAGASASMDPFPIGHGPDETEVRLPNGGDLLALAQDESPAPQDLFSRCAAGAPAGILDEIEAEMARRDPYAEIVFATQCKSCGTEIQGLFDPLLLLTRAMASHGGVTAELSQLARFYGWPDSELGAITAYRRRLYLDALQTAQADGAERGLS